MRKLLVVLLTAACVVGFATSSMAAIDENWALDGRVGFFTAWTANDEDFNGGPGNDSTTNLRWEAKSVRLRANYVTDKLRGQFELEDSGVDLAWIEANFGSFFFMFGRNDPLSFNPVGSPPGPNGNLPVGQALGNQNNIMRLRFPISDMFTLSVEGENPNTTYATNAGATSTEIMLPALTVKGDFLTGGIPWAVWGGYQTIDAKSATFDETISSYQVGGVVRPKLGPVAINASIMYDVNQFMTGGPPWHATPGSGWTYSATQDTEMMGFAFSLGYVISPKFSIMGGAGWMKWENDADDEDESLGYYVNLPIQLTPNLRLLPYVTIDDRSDIVIGTSKTEEGTQTEFGAYWEVTF